MSADNCNAQCHDCNGTGKYQGFTAVEECSACKGTGRTPAGLRPTVVVEGKTLDVVEGVTINLTAEQTSSPVSTFHVRKVVDGRVQLEADWQNPPNAMSADDTQPM